MYHAELPYKKVQITAVFISPDGRNVYAIATYVTPVSRQNAVIIWKRDTISGRLSNRFIQKTDLLGDCRGTVSPDNRNVYVAVQKDWNSGSALAGTIAYWSRSNTTGHLTNKRLIRADTAKYVKGATDVSVSPDNSIVCAAATVSDAVVCWERDKLSGNLSNPQIFENNLDGAQFVTFSPDSLHLYASAADGHAIVHWKRDPNTRIMTNQTVLIQDEVLLDSVHELAVSPDGRYVYAAVTAPGKALVYWHRDRATGNLSNHHVVGPRMHYDTVTVSHDGRNIYSACPESDILIYWTLASPFPCRAVVSSF